MCKTKLFVPWLKAAIGGGIFLAWAVATASQLETWSWTHAISDSTYAVYLADMAQAEIGRSYALYRVGDSNGGHVALRGYFFDGTQIFDATVNSGANVTAGRAVLSKPINGAQYVYASAHYLDNASHYHGVVVKYDTAGNYQWQYDPSPGSGAAYVIGMDGDSAGNAYFAFSFTAPSPHLEVVKLDSAGNVLSLADNSMIQPYIGGYDANHVSGHWVVNGSDNNSVGASTMWGLFSDTTATVELARSFTDDSDANNNYHFLLAAQPYNGGVLDGLDMQVSPKNGAPLWTQHEVAFYGYTGGPQWHTNWLSGWAYPISTADPGLIYSTVDGTGGHKYLQQISPFGAVNWTKPLPSSLWTSTLLAPDSSGCFVAGSTTSNAQALLYRYDSTGVGQWSTPPTGGQVTALITSNGTTFISTLNESGGNQSGAVERFVAGVEVSYVASSTAVVHSGNTMTVTPYLNATASSSFPLAMHSDNPHLLFSNNLQDMSVNVPTGANHVAVVMHALTVANNESGQERSENNGVSRTVNVTISP